MRLTGKSAIITGAGRGIGKATALQFAREGADVLVPDLDLPASEAVARGIQALGRKGVSLQVNVTRMADIRRMMEVALREFGKIDYAPFRPGSSRDRRPCEEPRLRLMRSCAPGGRHPCERPRKGDTTMKAAVWKGLDHLDIDDWPTPAPKEPYDVQIKVVACGVCGTDYHILEGKFPIYAPPRVIGHEYVGTVTAVGSAVTKVKVGDRVAVEQGLPCDRCYFCRDGREHLCNNRFSHPGGYAEYTCVVERMCHKLPDGLSWEVAALAEPVACALRVLDLVQIRSGDVALVQGGGAIGCIMTQLLLHSGISKVILSEPVAHRREIARAVGAAVVVDPKTEDLAAIVKGETDGLGPEYTFDCVGHPKLLEEGIRLVRKGGTVFVVGVADPAGISEIKPYELFAKELRIMTSYMRPYTFARAVRWLPHLNLKPIVGVEYPLAKTKEAIHALRQIQQGCKILVKP